MRWPFVWRSEVYWRDEELTIKQQRIDILSGELDVIREHNETLTRELELAHSSRVATEALAAERRAENERLIDQLREMREDLRRVLEERLKSLDSLNTRLMTPRVEDKPPDPATFKRSEMAELGRAAIGHVRMASRQMDEKFLSAKFPHLFSNPAVPVVAAAAPPPAPEGEGRPSMDAVVG